MALARLSFTHWTCRRGYEHTKYVHTLPPLPQVGAALWDGGALRTLGTYSSYRDARQSCAGAAALLSASHTTRSPGAAAGVSVNALLSGAAAVGPAAGTRVLPAAAANAVRLGHSAAAPLHVMKQSSSGGPGDGVGDAGVVGPAAPGLGGVAIRNGPRPSPDRSAERGRHAAVPCLEGNPPYPVQCLP